MFTFRAKGEKDKWHLAVFCSQQKETTQMSGVAVDSDVITQLSFGKDGAKYFVVKLSADLSQMVMDHTGSTTASWEDMSSALPKNEPLCILPF